MKNKNENSPSAGTILMFLLILVSAGVIILKDKNEIEELKQKQAALSVNLEVRDSMINEMLTTFNKVEQNLTFLRAKRSEITLVSGNDYRNRQEMLITDVVLMNKLLVSASKKQDELHHFSKTSDFENELLKNEIVQLNKLLETYKKDIQELKKEVDNQEFELTQNELQVVHLKSDND